MEARRYHKIVPKIFKKFIGKHVTWSLFLVKLLTFEKVSKAEVSLKLFRTANPMQYLRTAASKKRKYPEELLSVLLHIII